MVYADPAVTDIACAGLNGMRMGERTLTVRRATEVRCDAAAGCLTQGNGLRPVAHQLCRGAPRCALLLLLSHGCRSQDA